MVDDLEITITAAEPLAQGDNVTLRYDNNAAQTSTFSLAAVADAVEQLNEAFSETLPAAENLKLAGANLFNELLDRQLVRIYDHATTRAISQKRPLRLRINSNQPALLAVPWEYLYDDNAEQWLALRPDLSLMRSLPVAGREPEPVDGLLRVLVMISDPDDWPPLDSAVEWANLEAVADMAALDLYRVAPTYEALLGALRQLKPHVFHFIGHGFFDEDRAQGMLSFKSNDGMADNMDAEKLATALMGCTSLRLALLNACQGATAGSRSAFAGVAQRLIQQGLAAVIAMQAPILDTDAQIFSQEFYRALADGYDLEAALHQGRIRIAERSTAWGVPTLYSQGSEPFAIPKLTDEEKAARLWDRVQGIKETTRRRPLLAQILALVPNHAEAQKAQTRLENEKEAAHLYAAVVAYIANETWHDAYHTLLQIEQLIPNFRDTAVQLAEVLAKLGQPTADAVQAGAEQAGVGSADEAVSSNPAQVEAYKSVRSALLEGRLTLFLGGEVSRIGRPAGDPWVKGASPPGATDIAQALAARLSAELQGEHSLLQISQYTLLLDGEPALYNRLSALYEDAYTPTILHRLLAKIPAQLATHGQPKERDARYILFSSALDDLLERAFDEAAQPYHLFAYRPRFVDDDEETHNECFLHIPPAGEPIEVLEPNQYTAHDGDDLPIIVKLCGRRVTTEPDSVAVTEDQYMNYAAVENSRAVLPTTLRKQLKSHSFLFFGHSLQPWHLRLLWQRLRIPHMRRKPPKWAIVSTLTRIEEMFWRDQDIEPIVAQPEGVVAYVNDWLESL